MGLSHVENLRSQLTHYGCADFCCGMMRSGSKWLQ